MARAGFIGFENRLSVGGRDLLEAGIADEKRCLPVVIGVDMTGKKYLLALREGFRESAQSWCEVLTDLKKRRLGEPAMAADGGLGFWAALPKVWNQSKQQLCRLHKMRNILDKLPKREHEEAVLRLRAIYLAESVAESERLANKLLN